MPVNDQAEIDQVRANCGGAGEANLPDADIDDALSIANDETTERTGLLEGDLRLPNLRKKMKILIATGYLLIRFANMQATRDSIVKEIERLTTNMKTLESTDTDEESIIDSDPYATADAQQINFWTAGKKRSIGRTRTVFGYNDEYWLVRLGEGYNNGGYYR